MFSGLGFGCKYYADPPIESKSAERYQKYAWKPPQNHENGEPVVDQQPKPKPKPSLLQVSKKVDPLVELSKFYREIRSDYQDGFRDFEGRRLSHMDSQHVAIQRIINFTANLDDLWHFTIPKAYQTGGYGDFDNNAIEFGVKGSRNQLLDLPQVLIFRKMNGLMGGNRFQAYFEVENLTKNEIRFGITSDLYEKLKLYTFKPSARVTLEPGQKILMKITTREGIKADLTYADFSQDRFKIAGVLHLTLEQIEKFQKLGKRPTLYNVDDYSRAEFDQFMKSESKIPCQINHNIKICNWTEVYDNFEKGDDGVPLVLLKPETDETDDETLFDDLVNGEYFGPMEYKWDEEQQELLPNEGLKNDEKIDQVVVEGQGGRAGIKYRSIMKDLVPIGVIFIGALALKYLPVSFYLMTKLINDAVLKKKDY